MADSVGVNDFMLDKEIDNKFCIREIADLLTFISTFLTWQFKHFKPPELVEKKADSSWIMSLLH